MSRDIEDDRPRGRWWIRIPRKGASWLFQFLVVVGALLTLFIAVTPQGKAGFHTVCSSRRCLTAVNPGLVLQGNHTHEVRYQSSDVPP